MDTFLIKAAQLILALAFLVIIHEFGHFLFARIFKVKVDRFYMFFNPWMALVRWKPGKYVKFFSRNPGDDEKKEENGEEPGKKEKDSFWGNTEYGIGWLPLGGYCAISGMVDETQKASDLSDEPQPWEFRTKPAWQRLLIMIAGVLFNFLLAIIIYAGIVFWTGEKYVPFEKAEMGFAFSPEAQKAGFRDGDIPIAADGKALDHPDDARMKMLNASEVEVLRDGEKVSIKIPEKFIFRIDEEMKSGTTPISFMAYRFPAQVQQVVGGQGAAKAGLKEGDRIIAVGDTVTESFDEFMAAVAGHPDQDMALTIVRGAQTATPDTINTTVHLNGDSKMGIALVSDPSEFFESTVKEYNVFQSVPRGIQLGVNQLTTYVGSMKHLFTKEGAKSVGGFGTIGSIFPESWDWIAFWNIAAFLSVALAFMNILPIPALDGGHVLFLLIEVITGRKPGEKFMEYAQMVGMGILLLLLVYANGMDIVRFFIK